MSEFKQTWWDSNLATRFEEFASWLGTSDSTSKVLFRNYVKEREFKTLIDLGCGNATEFEAYKKDYPQLNYLGVDSSKFLFDRNVKLGVPMMVCPAENVPLKDGAVEVVFSRHVLEHQPKYQPVLKEMIRLAEKEAIHVFFIKPGDNLEHIGYDPNENLYHNRYNISDIEHFLKEDPRVKSFEWIDISEVESAIIIRR